MRTVVLLALTLTVVGCSQAPMPETPATTRAASPSSTAPSPSLTPTSPSSPSATPTEAPVPTPQANAAGFVGVRYECTFTPKSMQALLFENLAQAGRTFDSEGRSPANAGSMRYEASALNLFALSALTQAWRAPDDLSRIASRASRRCRTGRVRS